MAEEQENTAQQPQKKKQSPFICHYWKRVSDAFIGGSDYHAAYGE